MIKFFRKIRQKLLSENKFSKYLVYAIGEIVLVVIGILIALQINTWNQDRIDRKLEKKVLIDMREELMTNKSKIFGTIGRRKAKLKPIERYMNLRYEGNISYKDFIEIHKVSFFSGSIRPSFGVINSLISSGDVNLISNDSLKYLITDWKDTAALFIAVEEASFQGHRRFSEYFDKRFPSAHNKFHNFNSEDLQDQFEKIINDVEYANRIHTIQNHLKGAIRTGQDILEHIDGMIRLIRWRN